MANQKINQLYIVSASSGLLSLTIDDRVITLQRMAKHPDQKGRAAISQAMLKGFLLNFSKSSGLQSYSFDEKAPLEEPATTDSRSRRSISIPVVAIFTQEEAARECLEHSDLKTYDRRWRPQTSQSLKKIGLDHPCLTVTPQLLEWSQKPAKK